MNTRCKETVIIVGTFNRYKIAEESLTSLFQVDGVDTLTSVIVVDSSNDAALKSVVEQNNADYMWLPGDVSMAAARNVAYQYAKQKYTYDWVMFAEDDLIYRKNWYNVLISRAKELYGNTGPHGLIYGAFSASPGLPKGETVIFDQQNNCYSNMFGPRADQRLYKASHYENIIQHWDSDLLGISSCQTGQQISRNVMRGFCSANISHLDLCEFVDGEESTWVGIRDIGPAAFDKRMEGYKAIKKRVKQLNSGEGAKSIADIKAQTTIPMTETKFDEKISFKRKIKRYLRRMIFGH